MNNSTKILECNKYPTKKQLEIERKDYLQEERKLAHLASIGEQVVNIAHEARSPLTTILFGLNDCQKLKLSAEDRERVSLAQDEAIRLKQLLDDLVSQAKSPSNCTLLHCPLELNLLIDETLKAIRQSSIAQRERIEFVSQIPIVWIKGERERLKQTLVDLITYVCVAIENGEKVFWQIVSGGKDRVCICIYSGGQLLSCELPPYLKTPGLAAKPRMRLKLAMSKQLIEAHGGKLIIESGANNGTAIAIDLPIFDIKEISKPVKTTQTL